MAEELKLIGMWASAFNSRVELALKLKGIPYEYVEEDLLNKSSLLLKHNPVHKKIPVLLHNGNPVAESLIILEYIDKTWSDNPILPRDSHDRAMALFWARFIDEKLSLAAYKANTAEETERERAREEFWELLRLLENELKGKDFFGGERIGYLDILAMVLAFWFPLVQQVVGLELLGEEKFPAIHKWIDKLHAIDVVNECVPPKDRHLAYIRARYEALKEALGGAKK